MKRLIMTSLALCAAVASAMPEKKELAKSQPLVNELMSSVVEDYKAKKKTAKEVAETAEKFANEAEGEAAKFLLLKGAITYYSRAAEYDKAADMVEAIKAGVKDVPPEVLSEIISKATLRISSKNAPRLFAQYKAARAQVKAQKELRTLEAALKKRPGNLVARREYAEALAVSGDWQKALKEFAQLKDTAAAMAKAELDGKAKSTELAEFWWSYKTQSEEVEDALKARAAMYYKKAINAEELSGLKKTLAEQRIAEVGTSVVAAAVETAEDEVANEPPPGCKFITKGNEATMVFPNGVTMEFAKCPAGEFNMLYDYKNELTTPVKITRPFWFSKTFIKHKHLHSVTGVLKEDESPFRYEYLKFLDGNETRFLPKINNDFKKLLPKGYVIRLPSIAEYEYAYRANTKDVNDPYYNFKHSWPEYNKLIPEFAKGNKWGIKDMAEWCYLLDRIDASIFGDEVAKKTKWESMLGYATNNYPGKPEEKDPFLWTEAERPFAAVVGMMLTFDQRGWRPLEQIGGKRYHLVIGPDLVSEWRAKNKK